MEIKTRLTDLFQLAYEEEQRFIASLSDNERSATGTPERWSAKDVIAHVAAWKARMAASLAIARRGDPTERFDIDQVNAEILAHHRDLPWANVLRESQDACRQLDAQVDLLTEEELADVQRLPWQNGRPLWRLVVGNGYSHPVAHLAQAYLESGDRAEAHRLQEAAAQSLVSLDASPVWQGTVLYNLACHYALAGEKSKAITTLGEAFRLNPALLEWSTRDSDLDSIRDEPAFQLLVETGRLQPSSSIDEPRLRETLSAVLGHIMSLDVRVEYRLVGTAAALLHGVQLPVADIDLLVRERQVVDTCSQALASYACRTPPTYLPDMRQYYTAYEVNGVEVGISTVEWETDSDSIECLGRGPWEHFVNIPCGAYTVPTVALELRLVSELYRNRPERYIPLIQFMQTHGCDTDLLRRGMTARGISPAVQNDVLKFEERFRQRVSETETMFGQNQPTG